MLTEEKVFRVERKREWMALSSEKALALNIRVGLPQGVTK